MEGEWGNGARDRMRERKNFISVFPSFCCKTLKFLTFCHKTLKYVTFCRKMLKYGTFSRECRKNLNIRAMRKWFWIKSGCEEAPQVVPACMSISTSFAHLRLTFLSYDNHQSTLKMTCHFIYTINSKISYLKILELWR